MNLLVIANHDGRQVDRSSLSAIEFARQVAGEEGLVQVLLLGYQIDAVADEAALYAQVLCADHEILGDPLSDRFATVIASVAEASKADIIAAASSSWAHDVVGRAAGLLWRRHGRERDRAPNPRRRTSAPAPAIRRYGDGNRCTARASRYCYNPRFGLSCRNQVAQSGVRSRRLIR